MVGRKVSWPCYRWLCLCWRVQSEEWSALSPFITRCSAFGMDRTGPRRPLCRESGRPMTAEDVSTNTKGSSYKLLGSVKVLFSAGRYVYTDDCFALFLLCVCLIQSSV